MPKTPTGAKRPADTVKNAILVARIATGDTEDKPSKVPARSAGGKKGGAARAKALSAERRKAISAKATKARWSRKSSA